MHKNLVSIIVPIYNVEQYIEKCVCSLLVQDYPEIEIILVDDGSPDKSGEIIDEFARMDERVRVIHKKNGGVSSARNAGLRVACGEYIMFVDGDDYVDPDYVSYFLNLVLKYNCKIGMNFNNYTYKTVQKQQKDSTYTINSYKAIEYIYTGKIFVAVWNKIYSRAFLLENKIEFDTNFWYGEGMLFNISCLQFVDKIAIGEKKVYHQVYNIQSAMRDFNLESNFCGIRSLDRQKELWVKKSKAIENAWDYHYLCFSCTILCGLTKARLIQKHCDVYQICKKNLLFQLKVPMKVDIGFKRKLIHILFAFFPTAMANRSAKKDWELAKKYTANSDAQV